MALNPYLGCTLDQLIEHYRRDYVILRDAYKRLGMIEEMMFKEVDKFMVDDRVLRRFQALKGLQYVAKRRVHKEID